MVGKRQSDLNLATSTHSESGTADKQRIQPRLHQPPRSERMAINVGLVDCLGGPRCHGGAASFRRGVPPSLEAAPAATVGRTVQDPTQRLPQHPAVAAQRRAIKVRHEQGFYSVPDWEFDCIIDPRAWFKR